MLSYANTTRYSKILLHINLNYKNFFITEFEFDSIKITRIKNRWKFHLKDGIMNINGKDYLFSKANGDAEW
jgi:hypothetical protein